MQHIRLETLNRVGYIIINKPKANSYDIALMQSLSTVIDEANNNPEIKIIAIKSELDKFFCAGADIKVFQQNSVDQNKAMVHQANIVTHKISKSPKIVVALIAGHTLGGGLELALACDIRLASDANYFIGLPEINLGLIPGNGGTQRLIRIVNQSKALELLISGDAVLPDYAFEIGLVNQLYPKDTFADHSKNFLEKLAKGPIKAMSAIKTSVYHGRELSLENGLKLEQTLADELYITHDAQEGLKAFVEKRKAIFK